MKPTTDELIKIMYNHKEEGRIEAYELCYYRLQGRLDVLEEELESFCCGCGGHSDVLIKKEIAKIKEVMKDE